MWRCKCASKKDAKTKKRKQIYVKAIEMKILLNWYERYLQINMKNRSISRAKQKQKQQNDIDFADVCCLKLLEFVLFEFLLIDAFWLTANFEFENIETWIRILTHKRLTKSCEKDELVWLSSKSIDSCSSILYVIVLVSCVIDSSLMMLIAKM